MNINFKTMKPITLLIIITLALLGTIGIIYAASQVLTIPGQVRVIPTQENTEGVLLALNATTLDWGDVQYGTPKTAAIEITNNGDTTSATLQIQPLTPDGILIEPNQGAATPIGPEETRTIIFTLTIAETVQPGQYGFVINIGY